MWIKVKEAKNFEVSDQGIFRDTVTGRIYVPHCGSLYPRIALIDLSGRLCTRQAHVIVAQYFLNNGRPIDKKYKVVVKDGNFRNLKASNLSIEFKTKAKSDMYSPEKEGLYIAYGDEIYC